MIKFVHRVSEKMNYRLDSINRRIRISLFGIALMVAIIVGGVALPTTYINIKNSNYYNLQEFTRVAVQNIAADLKAYQNSAAIIAKNPVVSNTNLSFEERYEQLQETASLYEFDAFGIIDRSGINLEDNKDASGTSFYQSVLKDRKPYISAPMVGENTNGGDSAILLIAAPIMNNHSFDGLVYFTIDSKRLNSQITSIRFGRTGTTTLIDESGVMIAHDDYDVVLDQFSAIEEAAKDKSYKHLADITRKQIKGDTGIGTYKLNGVNKTMAYAPVAGTDWSIGVSIENRELLKPVYNSFLYAIGALIVTLIISVYIARKVSNSIATPIKTSIERIKLLAQGDLHSPMVEVYTNDETAILASSTEQLVRRFSEYIGDTTNVLNELAKGNLTVKSEKEYIGDFVPIQEATNKIIDSIHEMMTHIHESVSEVRSGSEEIAIGASAIANGAAEQASVIEEFIASTEEISNHIHKNIEQVQRTSKCSETAKEKADDGMHEMEQMLIAMEQVSKSSQKIAEVIHLIENIAQQTNLLSLNAAIESARAGEAGRGFAVVADEIRKLANQSSETIKKIEDMVKEGMANIEAGQQMAKQTAAAFREIVIHVDETAKIAEQLLNNSSQQEVAIHELMSGTKQLNAVIETNSATSQESAAISVELAAQAENLKDLIDYFKLRKNG